MLKKITLYILLLFSVNYITAQTADSYIGLGENMEKGSKTKNAAYRLDSALYYYRYVLDNFPTFRQECSKAMFRIAGVLEKDSINESIRWYNRIITSPNVNDKDKGMEVMEVYANYRHNSCLRLATLYLRKRNYDEALQWLYNAQYVYKYETYVGTAFENKMVSIATIKFESYKSLDYQDSAIYALVHKMLDTDVKYYLKEMDETKNNVVDHYTKVAKIAIKYIDQTRGKEEFKLAFNKAIKKLKVKKDKDRKSEKLTYASFKLYNIEYRIHSSIPKHRKVQFMNEIMASTFYLQLQE
ncbi:MAG: hypothetical protein SGJ10_06865 [Bacteroidota bacterium]|nr:hypothetical protein [Bacteroidota bacterium]